ncbi:MAG: DUF2059 domain-containing protein, partial [Spirochaetia bacterium]|nr:DUF2059 domain-containing protein [Spirochaetia bacterium]
MKKTIIALIFFFSTIQFSYAGSAAADLEYAKTLKLLFSVSGTQEVYATAIKQLIEALREQHPEMSAELWAGIEKEFFDISLTDLVDMLIPAYQKYFTINYLKEIIKFYNTPVGRKYAQNL